KRLENMGFSILSTKGTAKVLKKSGLDVEEVGRIEEAKNKPLNVLNLIKENKIALIINTPSGESSQYDMRSIRAASILHNVPCITTIRGARAAIYGMENAGGIHVKPLQDYYQTEGNVSCAV
ncbi:MAG: carbamoyl phosphate synthase large subunit, partial [Candidatus Omnitrophica bacterium]|nr:carbamoyl phosphate synthase large subunit [Candidatus Omnitrophota bacterium]